MIELLVFAAFAAVAIAVSAILALVLSSATRFDVKGLRRRLERAETELRALRGEAQHPAESAAAPAPQASPSIKPEVAVRAAPPRVAAPVPPPPAAPAPARAAPPHGRFEEQLTRRWLVWLGGLAIAMGGLFLVKLSFDRGWITPELRVLAGLALAIAMIASGEGLRSRRHDAGARGFVPSALVAGGLATAFGALFAAHRLYALVDASMAFMMLGAVAMIGVGLALRHNAFVALVGLVGGYAVPALVQAAEPDFAALYLYLAAVSAAVAWVTRRRAWWSIVAPVDLTFAFAWCFYGIGGPPGAESWPWPALFAAYLALLRFVLREGHDEAVAGGARAFLLLPARGGNLVALAAGALAGFVFVVLALQRPLALAELAALFAFAIAGLVVARRAPRLEALPVLAAATALCVTVALALVAKPLDPPTAGSAALFDFAGLPSLYVMLGFGLLFALAGFAFVWGAARPGFWAALSGFVPPIYIAILHAAAPGIGGEMFWTALALGASGLSLAAFLFAARRFGGRLAIVLDAGALVLALALIGLEIRTIAGADGRFDGAVYGLFEQALHAIAWLGLAFVLLRWSRRNPNPVLSAGWRAIFLLGLAQLALFPMLLSNPLGIIPPWRAGPEVGGLAILNLLAIAYALPALLCLAIAGAARGVDRGLSIGAAAASLVLAFVWITLEIRHAFHGSNLGRGPTGDGEWYAYSAAWLIFGVALLLVAIARRTSMLRWASLAVVMLAVAKVFLWDMSALTGLYRALSFFCLGLALVGIGYLYQRFVFPRPPLPAPA